MWLLDRARIVAARVGVLGWLHRRGALALHVGACGRVTTTLAHQVVRFQHVNHATIVCLVRIRGRLQLGRCVRRTRRTREAVAHVARVISRGGMRLLHASARRLAALAIITHHV